MKKQSVNGKSFDEIFAQRGNLTAFEKTEIGSAYYCTATEEFLAAIFEPTKSGRRCFMLAGDGGFSGCAHCADSLFFGSDIYEATTDQIDLLNAYKNA